MDKLSKKHWIAFSIIILFQIISFAIATLGTIVPISNIFLCLFLIHRYLQEPLSEYGVNFKNLHIQIISGFFLAYVFLFLTFNNIYSRPILSLINHYYLKFSSLSQAFLFCGNILMYVIAEEIIFRGFFLSFFQKVFPNSLFCIFLCAFLFGISHYPMGQNWNQVIFTSIFGMVFGYLRIKEPEKFTLFSLSLAHFIYNCFVL